jgi:catechol 2,3-dioxygenase-like lactoylglutathione lyase family enzyme
MPVVAAHMLLYTPEADAVRAVFRDAFGWKHVEDHPGWLIFAMPPSELGIHPSEGSTKHEICLMCDDLESTMAELRAKGIEFRGGPQDQGFGIVTTMLLPGGVEMLLYQSKHASPLEEAGGIEQL